MLLQGMTMALTKLPPGSEVSTLITEFMTKLGKLVPAGAVSSQGVSNSIKQMAMKQQQMAPHMGAMQTQGAHPPMPGGAPPPAPG